MKYQKIVKKLEQEMCVTRELFCPTATEMGEILGTIYDNPGIGYDKLTKRTDVKKERIKENIDELKKHGYLAEEKEGYVVTRAGIELIFESEQNN